MIELYLIRKTQSSPVTLPDMASLDAITRQLPEGYYSTFRTYAGCTRVIGLSAHLRRLPHVDASVLRRNLVHLLEPYRPDGEARVRVMETKRRKVYISIEPLQPLPREIYEKGVRVETTTIQRHDPRAKSTAFISVSDKERKHIAQEGVFEALLVKNGKILEGMTSNFFYILRAPENHRDYPGTVRLKPYDLLSKSGRCSERSRAQREVLYTAQKDILLGVTRTMVIRAARGGGVEVRYRALELSQLPVVQEAFITSSSRGIVPVIQIDNVMVGRGRVGPVTRQLMLAYEKDVLKNSEPI
ncbi:MAG TPA: aminotransferase class IV [Anaerolineales bacterium]|nr:aminotransferase class IV [Anaerolineales bacterium]